MARFSEGNPEQEQGHAFRKARIVEMRKKRIPMTECAAEFGISVQYAYKIYREAISEYPSQMVEEYRREELDLTDTAVRGLLDIANGKSEERTKWVKGEPVTYEYIPTFKDRIEAWAVIGRWSEHKMKITGGYAPEKIMFTNESVTAEIERLMQLIEAESASETLAIEP